MNFRCFNHQDYGDIRVTCLSDTVPLFVAKDIAEALGYSNTSNCISKYCKHDVMANMLDHKAKNMRLIPEGDVYRLVLRSKSRRAIEFQDWLCEEVLPKLRSTSSDLEADGWQEQLGNKKQSIEKDILNFAGIKSGCETEQKLKTLECKIDSIIKQIGVFNDIEKNYSTLPGYIQSHRLPVLVSEYPSLGSRISDMCRRRGIKLSKITYTHGELNLYPNFILHEVFKNYMK